VYTIGIEYNLVLIFDWQKYIELFIYVFFVQNKVFEVLIIKYSSKKYIGFTCCEPAVTFGKVWNIEKFTKAKWNFIFFDYNIVLVQTPWILCNWFS